MSKSVSVTLTQTSGYQFTVDFGGALPSLLADEPPPLGLGEGPAPSHMLVAAAANCLAASLLFALKKFQQASDPISATAHCEIGRNDEGRLRVLGIQVDLSLGVPAAELVHLERVLEQFEAFCTVSQSIQSGVPVTVSVSDSNGVRLKG